MDDLFTTDPTPGVARPTDPFTSHIAARLANVTKGQIQVVEALERYGPQTMAEVGKRYGYQSDTIGPRFKPLRLRRIIRYVRDADGEIVTRPGDTGRPRIVFEIQPDSSLWLDEVPPEAKSTVTKKELEARLEDALALLHKVAAPGVIFGCTRCQHLATAARDFVRP
tara:strand:+ start:49 stop:549 length:501 start_codon:yes stop_codon:yes gene_type:complete